jgi:hypothetical protein
MNAATVRRVMDLIPERVARTQSGAQFVPTEIGCRFADRVQHLAKFLHWMSPLEALSRDDQQALGLLNAAGRPVHAVDLEDDLDGGAEGDLPEAVSELAEAAPEEQETALA